MTFSFKKPSLFIKIDEKSHIGLHIKKRRLELKIEQKEAAKLLKVSEATVSLWETRKGIPRIENVPKVIEFLGYNPYPFETVTLGGRIKYYRLMHGLSHRKMGAMVGVDAATISTWETGKFTPDESNLYRLNELLNN